MQRAVGVACLGLLFGATVAPLATADDGGIFVDRGDLAIPRQETGAARIGGAVFVVGGLIQGFAGTATVEVYDIGADQWNPGPAMPAPRHHAAVAAHGARVFVIGGFQNAFNATDTVFVLDTASGVWSNAAVLPEPLGAGWAVTVGDAIYHFGGTGSGGATNRTYRYDVPSGVWTRVRDMPTPREHLTAAALGGFVHVVGGRVGASTDAHERYDPVADAWQTLAPLPTARSAAATAVFEGRLFVMGGEVPMLFAVNEAYDPAADVWTAQTPMPLPRHGIAAVALDDAILLPAGGVIQGFLPTASCDAFVPDDYAGAVPFCLCVSQAPCGNIDAHAGCANSTGAGARLSTCGTASVVRDNLELVVESLQPSAFGILFMGSATTSPVALGDGQRCVDSGSTGLFRFPVRTADASGTLREGPRLAAFTAVSNPIPGQITAGSTWHFQAWYRDIGPCATGSNLSNALSVSFVP